MNLGRITAGQRIVLVLLGLSLIGGLATGAPIYYRLAYVWILLYAGNAVWAWFSLRGVQIKRRARQLRGQLGQIFEERIDVTNQSRLPRVWLEIEDGSPLPGSQGSQVFGGIGGRQTRTYITRTRLIRRGVFPLGPTTLHSGDLFGMFPRSKQIAATQSALVYPMLVDIQTFPGPIGYLPGGDALQRRTPQITPNAAGVREYAPGDSLNRIHWTSTARRDRLMVKEFELDPQADVWIFLDADAAANHSKPWDDFDVPKALWDSDTKIDLPPATEEYAACIAASLSRYYLRQRRAVGMVSRGETPLMLPPDRGGRQLVKILEALAIWKADGELPVLGLIEAQAKHLTRGSTVVLITASVSDEIAVAADYLGRRGLRPVPVLIDAESFNGPAGSRELMTNLQILNLPVRVVRNGDLIELALRSNARS